METKIKTLEEKILENGFDIDMDEGWHKLTTSQFGGKPGRAFSELIQNAIDSYPPETPFNERKGEISTSYDSIRIKDWGEGMDVRRLALLTTAGGTDKFGDSSKIGQFGLGFISIFNPGLGTTRVTVVTKCEGHTVELVFIVTDPEKRPEIKLRVLENQINFSTDIRIEFKYHYSVTQCLEYAEKSLTYFPCSMRINGNLFKSLWYKKNIGDAMTFSEKGCHGIIKKNNKWLNLYLLCKYELVLNTSLQCFITGGHDMKHNLQDFEANGTPFLNNIDIVFNIDNLRLTISRDGYYLDWVYISAKTLLNSKLKYFLYLDQVNKADPAVIIANQYIFRNEILSYLSNLSDIEKYNMEENRLIALLAETPVFRINGRSGMFSLAQLKKMLHYRMPFYYSPERTNLRWLGGSYKHDFVVIPNVYETLSGTPKMYDLIFESVFQDVVNLDDIMENSSKLKDLVDRGLVKKSALSPICKIIGARQNSRNQNNLLQDLNQILKDHEICEMIERNLQISVKSVKPTFFSVRDGEVCLSTGLFDKNGYPINEEYISNIVEEKDGVNPFKKQFRKVDILLGLNIDHPFINYLCESKNPQRGYYTLTFLAHELALCQKMLVPYSPFYHLVKEKLGQDMRKVLMKNMLKLVKN